MSNSVSKETMADNSGVSNSMRGHKGGVVGNGVSNDWGVDSVSDSGSVVGGGSGVVLRVLGLAVVGDISNVSIVTIDVVVDVLDSAIRKSHGVRSLGVTSTVRRLGSIEVSLGVVITDGVSVAVGRGGVIAGGGVVNAMDWGMHSVGYNRGVDSMGQDGSVNSMGQDWSVDTMSQDRSVNSMGHDGSVDSQAVAEEGGGVGGGQESRETSEGLEKKILN